MSINPAAVESYRRAIVGRGDQKVIVRRISGIAPNTKNTDAKVGAIITDYVREKPTGGGAAEGAITLGARNVVVMAADLRALRFPLPIVKHDKIVINADPAQLGNGAAAGDEELDVMNDDPNRMHIAGAIEIIAEGSA